MRSPIPFTPATLLHAALVGAVLLAAPAAPQALPVGPEGLQEDEDATAEAAPDATSPATPAADLDTWGLLNESLMGLDQVLVQQLDIPQWIDVHETARVALRRVRAARQGGAPADVCLAVQRTLNALLARQDALMSPGDDVVDTVDRLADDLLFVEGRLPQTSLLLIETLFGLERDQEGAHVLSRALVLWPSDARLHDAARAWRNVIPAPENLINQLQARVDVMDSADTDVSGISLETIGMLHSALGVRTYEQADYAVAGLHFDAAARALHRSRSMPRKLPNENLNELRADAFVNASMAFLGHAQEVWYADRSDDEQAPLAMDAAEETIGEAMRLRPDHEPTLNAVLYIGEAWRDKAAPDSVTSDDLADAREFFGRMAERFDVADWWNNHAFWCRETAGAAEASGDTELARRLYERSYAAYDRAITLEPDNARFVNDTGLILLYHLDRELDKAEELFLRAWKLGKAVCDNPFVDEAVYAENLSAYGDAMLNLAKLYQQSGEYDRAQDINDQLRKVDPSRLDAQLLARQLSDVVPDDPSDDDEVDG